MLEHCHFLLLWGIYVCLERGEHLSPETFWFSNSLFSSDCSSACMLPAAFCSLYNRFSFLDRQWADTDKGRGLGCLTRFLDSRAPPAVGLVKCSFFIASCISWRGGFWSLSSLQVSFTVLSPHLLQGATFQGSPSVLKPRVPHAFQYFHPGWGLSF